MCAATVAIQTAVASLRPKETLGRLMTVLAGMNQGVQPRPCISRAISPYRSRGSKGGWLAWQGTTQQVLHQYQTAPNPV